MHSLAKSIFLCACETWTITADIERRIQALEMRCFLKLLGILHRDHITSEEVTARIRNTIGPYEDLLTSVKRHKLKWYGHVTQLSGLAKTVLQGTVQGGRQRGIQRKGWEDNIKEWTGLEWNIILRKAENREEWRKLVVKSTAVPQCSARLQDRSDKIRRWAVLSLWMGCLVVSQERDGSAVPWSVLPIVSAVPWLLSVGSPSCPSLACLSAGIWPSASWWPDTGPSGSPVRLLSLLV